MTREKGKGKGKGKDSGPKGRSGQGGRSAKGSGGRSGRSAGSKKRSGPKRTEDKRTAPASGKPGIVTAREILQHVREEADRPLKPRELAQALGVRRTDYPGFRSLVERLVSEGKLYRQREGRLAIPRDLNLRIGRLEVTGGGHGFVVPDDGPPDIFVRDRDLGSGVEGDRVVARIEHRPTDRNPRGRIIQILERAHSRVVGVFHARPGYAWVEAHEPRLRVEFFVPPPETGDASDGDLVLLEVLDWGDEDPRSRRLTHPRSSRRLRTSPSAACALETWRAARISARSSSTPSIRRTPAITTTRCPSRPWRTAARG
jgi:cold shock CspA family protein